MGPKTLLIYKQTRVAEDAGLHSDTANKMPRTTAGAPLRAQGALTLGFRA